MLRAAQLRPLKQARRGTLRRHASTQRPWRHSAIIDEWVQRDARPVSLRQLTVFGRTLTKARLFESANYVRTELPTRELQSLPYAVITNPNMLHVYDLYFQSLDTFRHVSPITTLEDNANYCKVLHDSMVQHLTVIPRLVTGVLECADMLEEGRLDALMNTLLRARISRRLIADQHLALTRAFTSSSSSSAVQQDANSVGEVFLNINAADIVSRTSKTVASLLAAAYGPSIILPEVQITGPTSATLVYIPGHLEYIIGELLRNSFQASIETRKDKDGTRPEPIQVLICEAPEHIIIRVSDHGGGISPKLLPHLWSFIGGEPRRANRKANLEQVPRLSGTLQEISVRDQQQLEPQPQIHPRTDTDGYADADADASTTANADADAQSISQTSSQSGPSSKSQSQSHTQSPNQPPQPQPSSSSAPLIDTDTSLSSLSTRPPNLRLGIGLPMSRVYAEFWAGSLELHSLQGYGVDAFLQLPRLGNRNETIETREREDAV